MINDDSSQNIVWHSAIVKRTDRELAHGHKSCLIWFTGLSGSGKSTLAHSLEDRLYRKGCNTIVLDGDNVRHGLCKDLGFSDIDRKENIRRVGEVAKLFIEAGVVVITAFISPSREDRAKVRNLVGERDFIEIFCDCSVEVCERRDVKGLYKKARNGLIKEFTGISAPYEKPENPDLLINTETTELDQAINQIMALIEQRLMIQ